MDKKKLFGILFVVIVIFLAACNPRWHSRYYDNSEQDADNLWNQVVRVIGSRDHEAFKKMFSPTALKEGDAVGEDMDQCINAFFMFFQGEIVADKRRDGVSTEGSRSYGEIVDILNMSCEIETTEDDYRIAIRATVLDTANPENEGIESLYITKAHEVEENHNYLGRGWYPGIVIEE